jgi:CxxC-x17-CxxC domain-containing protein
MGDQNLTCKDCGKQFVWTAGEQEFYQKKGFTNPPTRCPDCRAKKKASAYGPRQEFPITCSSCGKQDTVPFQPTGDRPVLCRECFAKQRKVS